jgi:inositol transport system substrate-binding protein
MKLLKPFFYLSLLLLAACNSATKEDGKMTIGVSMLSMQNEFIVNVADEMQKKADEMNVNLIIVDAERSALKQMEQVESFIAQGVDAIILNPCEVEASSPAVSRALAANIPIINVNSETSVKPSAFVGSNDEESARIAMGYIIEKLGGKGNIVIIHGFMGQAAQIQRDKGAKEILNANPNVKLLAEQTGEWDRTKGMDLMQNWIQSYGDKINAVFAHNDEMGLGAAKALENAGLKDKVIVVSIDAIHDALQAVKNGSLDATVFQNAKEQGAAAIISAINLAKGEKVEKEILIPFQLVTKSNINQF